MARIEDGNRRAPEKIVSIFEPHTQIIRKGKAHKPTEFGRLVRIDEVEGGVVTGFSVLAGNPPDASQFYPAVANHVAVFERAPTMATADRGYFSAENEAAAEGLGVRHVVLPARGRLSARRAERQRRRWFRRGLRWRGGVEPRIATLKHRFGMHRARYRGDHGFKRWTAWAVVLNNLVRLARHHAEREIRPK